MNADLREEADIDQDQDLMAGQEEDTRNLQTI